MYHLQHSSGSLVEKMPRFPQEQELLISLRWAILTQVLYSSLPWIGLIQGCTHVVLEVTSDWRQTRGLWSRQAEDLGHKTLRQLQPKITLLLLWICLHFVLCWYLLESLYSSCAFFCYAWGKLAFCNCHILIIMHSLAAIIFFLFSVQEVQSFIQFQNYWKYCLWWNRW